MQTTILHSAQADTWRMSEAFTHYDKVVCVTDENVFVKVFPALAWLESLPVLVLPAGEKFKNQDSLNSIYQFLANQACARSSLLLCVGGGVITDLGGFAASTYMRGIDVIHLPTTVLAMVDAAIGGKTGYNTSWGKNMLGSFYAPLAVWIYPEVLKTLPPEEYNSGLAEAWKTTALMDENLFHEMSNEPYPEDWISRVGELKNQLVSTDFKEKGKRAWLNFGHTIGHAIEHFLLEKSEFKLLHGESIAWGMLVELDIVHGRENALFKWLFTRVNELFPQPYISAEDIPELVDILKQDKKNSHEKIFLAVPKGIGRGGEVVEVDEERIRTTLVSWAKYWCNDR
jgi:3-dehydroquinate synthase